MSDPYAELPTLPLPAHPPARVAEDFWEEEAGHAPRVFSIVCAVVAVAYLLGFAGDLENLPPHWLTAGLALRATSFALLVTGIVLALRAPAFVHRHYRGLFAITFAVVAAPISVIGRLAGERGDLYWMGVLQLLLGGSTFFSLPMPLYLGTAWGCCAFYLACRLAPPHVWDHRDFNVVVGIVIFGFLASITHWVILRGKLASHEQRRRLWLLHEQKSAILSSITDAFFALDRGWRVVFMNAAGAKLVENLRPGGALLGKQLWEEFPGLLDSLMHDNFLWAMRQRVPVRYEEFYPLLGRDMEVKAFPARDGLAVYFHDVTELKRSQRELEQAKQGLEERVSERTRDLAEAKVRLEASLAEKEVLLREVHHRSKNNMQVLSSLIRLQAEGVRGDSDREALRASERRIRAMALVHEKLYRAEDLSRVDLGAYLRDLVGQLVPAFAQTPVRVRVSADGVPASIDTAVACGLLVNELVSNAVRHAFASVAEPAVEVVLQCNRAPAPSFELTVADNGPGLPAGFDPEGARSLGFQLVRTIARNQLGGELKVESSASGLSVRVRFPEKR